MEIALNLKKQEQELIAACLRKEKWAQQRLYEDHYGIMKVVCLRYASNEEEALDILHEGFIKVFKHIAKYKPGTSLKAWIKRIVVNTAIDWYRKNSRRRTEDLAQAYDVKAPVVSAISQLSEKEILKSVQLLSPAYRAVFNLYIMEGFSHKEIAGKLGITESTSRSNLVKARIKLKSILVAQGFRNG
jgi:RNA polymerase sigma-70 factor (ECF subfamily)